MSQVTIQTLFLRFLKLGAIGFGGPIALIALMEKEVCERGWMSHQKFNQGYLYCKLLPGPVAYQMALWIGHNLHSRWGGALCGIAFLIPSFILMLLISLFYKELKEFSHFEPLLEGMRIGALVVIGGSLWRMWSPFRVSIQSYLFLTAAFIGMWFFPRWEPLIIIAAGFLAVLLFRARHSRGLKILALPLGLQIFWVHFKAGAIVFGTGLAILPVLEQSVVHSHHWLTLNEFLDGISFGQVTPGPLTIISVFIGHQTLGVMGAFMAFIGMYLPGVFYILSLLPIVHKRYGAREELFHFQSAAIPAVIGCVFAATLVLASHAIRNPLDFNVLSITVLLASWFRLPGWLVIVTGSLIRWGITLY